LEVLQREIGKKAVNSNAQYTKFYKTQKSACKSNENMIIYLSCENDTRKNSYPTLIGVRPHPLVEHAAVNRGVVGSSPTRGVWEIL